MVLHFATSTYDIVSFAQTVSEVVNPLTPIGLRQQAGKKLKSQAKALVRQLGDKCSQESVPSFNQNVSPGTDSEQDVTAGTECQSSDEYSLASLCVGVVFGLGGWTAAGVVVVRLHRTQQTTGATGDRGIEMREVRIGQLHPTPRPSPSPPVRVVTPTPSITIK